MEPRLSQEVIKTAARQDGPIETDAVIVGAGPVGLFQVFELGLLEIKAHVIDSLAYPGGQCVELYPDKPIYDIPAVPVCTGQELTDNLLKQIEPFGATFHFGQEVTTVNKQDDGRFFVDRAAAYASGREVFGRPIGENQGIQFPIARAHVQISAAAAMVDKAAAMFEAGEPCGTEANMAKMLASEASWYAADMCIQTTAASASPRNMTSNASSAKRASTRSRRSART